MLLSELLFHLRQKKIELPVVAENFQEAFSEKDRQIKESLQWLAGLTNKHQHLFFSDPALIRSLEQRFSKDGLSFFLLSDNDSLLFWSNNFIPVITSWGDLGDKGLVQFQNGWYFFRTLNFNEFKGVVFATIKTSYKYQNRFLVNDYHPDIPVTENVFFIRCLRSANPPSTIGRDGKVSGSCWKKPSYAVDFSADSGFFPGGFHGSYRRGNRNGKGTGCSRHSSGQPPQGSSIYCC